MGHGPGDNIAILCTAMGRALAVAFNGHGGRADHVIRLADVREGLPTGESDKEAQRGSDGQKRSHVGAFPVFRL